MIDNKNLKEIFMAIKQQYHLLSSNGESTDSTMIDFYNSVFDDDNVVLLNTNIDIYNQYQHQHQRQFNKTVNNTLNSNTTNQILSFSLSYKNSIVKRLYWCIFIACLFSIPGLFINYVSYVETVTPAIRVYNIVNEYLYCYFFILMLFYAIYIGITFIILMITFYENLTIENVVFSLLITNMLFKVNIIFRLLVIGIIVIKIIVIRIINNILFMVIPINNSSYTDSENMVYVYLPRYVVYFIIIENIIYAYLAYMHILHIWHI